MGQYLMKEVSTADIEKYIPLVHKVVNQLNAPSSMILDREDLVSIGMLGLLDAYNRYDASKNVDFEGYAKLRVRGTIVDEIRKTGVMTRRQTNSLKQFLKASDRLQEQLLRAPTDEEIRTELGWTPQDLSKNYEAMNMMSTLSLDGLILNDRDEEVQDRSLLLTDPAESVLSKLEREAQRDVLNQAIQLLKPKEQQMLQLHYVEGLNFQEISDVLGVSPSRVSQLYRQAIGSLRLYIKR